MMSQRMFNIVGTKDIAELAQQRNLVRRDGAEAEGCVRAAAGSALLPAAMPALELAVAAAEDRRQTAGRERL